LTMSEDFQTTLLADKQKLITLDLLHKISLPLSTEKLEKAYYKGGKQYLNAQFRLILSNITNIGIRKFYRLFLWIISDDTLKLITGSYFKIIIPEFFLKFKNQLLSIFCRFKKKF
jgi:hypothetical protein